MTEHPEDHPWNDVPADSDARPGGDEPDPAEVSGTEDDDAVRDESLPRAPRGDDEYQRESLDQRLSEEEPDRTLQEQDPEAGSLQAPASGEAGGSVEAAEPDQEDPAEPRDEPAEEAAVHIVPDNRPL